MGSYGKFEVLECKQDEKQRDQVHSRNPALVRYLVFLKVSNPNKHCSLSSPRERKKKKPKKKPKD
jgi:hypothetical protein